MLSASLTYGDESGVVSTKLESLLNNHRTPHATSAPLRGVVSTKLESRLNNHRTPHATSAPLRAANAWRRRVYILYILIASPTLLVVLSYG